MSGRPPVAFGVWPDMIEAAAGAGKLALALGCSPRHLRRVFTGRSRILGPRSELARAFAEDHGIAARIYVHPSARGCCLLSLASGWFRVPNVPGGWARREVCVRSPDEDWSGLDALELDFASSWDCLSLPVRGILSP